MLIVPGRQDVCEYQIDNFSLLFLSNGGERGDFSFLTILHSLRITMMNFVQSWSCCYSVSRRYGPANEYTLCGC